MSAERTIDAIREFCRKDSGFDYEWVGNKNTYRWNLGRTPEPGNVTNGVVRKLAGVDAVGNKIWTLAGHLKIAPSGEILQFTGLDKKRRTEIEALKTSVPVVATSPVVEEV